MPICTSSLQSQEFTEIFCFIMKLHFLPSGDKDRFPYILFHVLTEFFTHMPLISHFVIFFFDVVFEESLGISENGVSSLNYGTRINTNSKLKSIKTVYRIEVRIPSCQKMVVNKSKIIKIVVENK